MIKIREENKDKNYISKVGLNNSGPLARHQVILLDFPSLKNIGKLWGNKTQYIRLSKLFFGMSNGVIERTSCTIANSKL